MGKSAKKLPFGAIQSLIHFQQYFVQGIWTSDDPLIQLPGVDGEMVKAYKRARKDQQAIQDGKIDTFCRLTPEQRANLNLFDGDVAKNKQLEQVVKAMPLVTVTSKAYVEGEKTMTASDIISIEIRVEYDNLPADAVPGYVCSKNYPFLKRSNWYIVIVDAQTKQNVVQVERIIPEDGNFAKFEMKQRFGRAGKFAFHCHVMSDSYVGFDKEISIEIDVMRDDPDRVIEEYSEEDLMAVKGPGIVQSLLQGEEEEDSDGSEDGEEVLLKKLEKAGIKTADKEKFEQFKKKQEAAKFASGT